MFFCYIVGYSVVKAIVYASPEYTIFATEIEPSGLETTATYKKNILNEQYYIISKNSTSLTNHCTNCMMAFSLKSTVGDVIPHIAIKIGQKARFGDSSSSMLNFNMSVYRTDFTVLTTYHLGTWYINPQS